MQKASKFYGCILGGIVGDAFGSPYEFLERDSYEITEIWNIIPILNC